MCMHTHMTWWYIHVIIGPYLDSPDSKTDRYRQTPTIFYEMEMIVCILNDKDDFTLMYVLDF